MGESKFKGVRVDQETYVKLLRFKHGLELEQRDAISMGDALKELVARWESYEQGNDQGGPG